MLAMLGTSELTQVVWTLAAVVEQNSPNTIRQPVRAWREPWAVTGLLHIQHQQTVADLPGWLLDSQEHTGPVDSIRGGQLYGPGRGGMDSAEGGVAQGEQKMGN